MLSVYATKKINEFQEIQKKFFFLTSRFTVEARLKYLKVLLREQSKLQLKIKKKQRNKKYFIFYI